jgi:hypothetical protein
LNHRREALRSKGKNKKKIKTKNKNLLAALAAAWQTSRKTINIDPLFSGPEQKDSNQGLSGEKMKEQKKKKKLFLPRGLIPLPYLDDNEASSKSVPAP